MRNSSSSSRILSRGLAFSVEIIRCPSLLTIQPRFRNLDNHLSIEDDAKSFKTLHHRRSLSKKKYIYLVKACQQCRLWQIMFQSKRVVHTDKMSMCKLSKGFHLKCAIIYQKWNTSLSCKHTYPFMFLNAYYIYKWCRVSLIPKWYVPKHLHVLTQMISTLRTFII